MITYLHSLFELIWRLTFYVNILFSLYTSYEKYLFLSRTTYSMFIYQPIMSLYVPVIGQHAKRLKVTKNWWELTPPPQVITILPFFLSLDSLFLYYLSISFVLTFSLYNVSLSLSGRYTIISRKISLEKLSSSILSAITPSMIILDSFGVVFILFFMFIVSEEVKTAETGEWGVIRAFFVEGTAHLK